MAGSARQADAQHQGAGGVRDRVPDSEGRDPSRALGQQHADAHRDDPADPGDQGDDGRCPAVTERVIRAGEREEHAVREQSDRQRRDSGCQQRDTVLGGLAEREDRHAGPGEHDHRRRHGDDEHRHRVERPTQGAREGVVIVSRRVERQLVVDRGVDGLGDHAVRREEEHPRHLVRHGPARHRVAEHDRGAQQQTDLGVLQDRPSRQSEEPVHRRIATSEAWSQPEAGPVQRDARHRDEGGDAERSAQGQGELLGQREIEPRIVADQNTEHHETGHDEDRVPDGRDRGDDEPSLGVQHGDGDGADRVEHHLRHEEPQEECSEALLLRRDRRVADTAGQEVGEPRSRDDAHDRHRAEDDQRDPQHAAGEAFRLRFLGTIEQVDKRGHEDSRQRARGEQLE